MQNVQHNNSGNFNSQEGQMVPQLNMESWCAGICQAECGPQVHTG